MSEHGSDVEAIIAGAGMGTRLGRGPKAFLTLGGSTLLARAVAAARGACSRVIVAVPDADIARARELVGASDVAIIAGAQRRIDTLRALVEASRAPWLLVHDPVHPFVTAQLARDVVAAAKRHGVAAAALKVVDFLYDEEGALRGAPGELLTVQKPIAFRREAVVRGFAVYDRETHGPNDRDPGALEIVERGGERPMFVPGHPANWKITTEADYELAQRVVGDVVDGRI